MTPKNGAAALRVAIALLVLDGLLGCAATQVALSKKDLVVQTKMSESIFLDPVEPDQQTVHIRIRNTSDKDFDLEAQVKAAIEGGGYQVVRSPSKARYRLQANVLAVEIADPTAAEAALSGGYGGTLAGATAGAVVGGASHGWRGAGLGAGVGGLFGAGTELVSGSLVHDVTYMVVTDIQLVEKAPSGAFVRTDTQIDNRQGTTGRSRQTVSTVGKDIKYRTRIVSTANKANLEYEEAHGPLARGIAKSLSGLF